MFRTGSSVSGPDEGGGGGGTEVYLLPSTQCLCSNWASWCRDDAIPGYITPSAWAMVAVDAIMSLSLIPEDVACGRCVWVCVCGGMCVCGGGGGGGTGQSMH